MRENASHLCFIGFLNWLAPVGRKPKRLCVLGFDFESGSGSLFAGPSRRTLKMSSQEHAEPGFFFSGRVRYLKINIFQIGQKCCFIWMIWVGKTCKIIAKLQFPTKLALLQSTTWFLESDTKAKLPWFSYEIRILFDSVNGFRVIYFPAMLSSLFICVF